MHDGLNALRNDFDETMKMEVMSIRKNETITLLFLFTRERKNYEEKNENYYYFTISWIMFIIRRIFSLPFRYRHEILLEMKCEWFELN